MLSQEQVLRNPPDRFSEGPVEKPFQIPQDDLVNGERFCGTIETHCVNALQTLRLVLPQGADPRVGYDYTYRIEDVGREYGKCTRTLVYILSATIDGEVLCEVAKDPGGFMRATSVLRAKCELAIRWRKGAAS